MLTLENIEAAYTAYLAQHPLQPKTQKNPWSCGQTALTILGYRNQALLHLPLHSGITQNDLLTQFPNAISVSPQNGRFLRAPQLILFQTNTPGITHWALRIKREIFCPSLGKIETAQYEQYVQRVKAALIIPPPPIFQLENQTPAPSHLPSSLA